MKTCFLIWFVIAATLLRAYAQDNRTEVSGVYLTEDDFKQDRLSEVAGIDSRNYIVVALNKLKCYRNGQKMNFWLRDIYGYYQDGKKYRAFRRQTFFDRYACYQIIDESGMMVYARKSAGHKRVGYTFYYWSVETGSPVIRVTRRNVRKTFIDHPDFVKQVSEGISKKNLYILDEAGKTRFNVFYQNLVLGNVNL